MGFMALRQLLTAPARDLLPRLKPAVQRATLSLCVCALVGGVALWGARWFQHVTVRNLVQRYLALPRDPLVVASTLLPSGHILLRPEGLSLSDRAHEPEESTADYLVATFQCGDGAAISVRSQFAAPVVSYSNWNRDWQVPCAGPGTRSVLMIPVYQYAMRYAFEGLVVESPDASRLVAVEVLRPDPSVRLWLDLLVPADWHDRAWYESLRSPLRIPS